MQDCTCSVQPATQMSNNDHFNRPISASTSMVEAYSICKVHSGNVIFHFISPGIHVHLSIQVFPLTAQCCVQEMEKVGPTRQYNFVYFNADAQLGAIPDTVFFQQLHAALHPNHKRNLKVLFIKQLSEQSLRSSNSGMIKICT